MNYYKNFHKHKGRFPSNHQNMCYSMNQNILQHKLQSIQSILQNMKNHKKNCNL